MCGNVPSCTGAAISSIPTFMQFGGTLFLIVSVPGHISMDIFSIFTHSMLMAEDSMILV